MISHSKKSSPEITIKEAVERYEIVIGTNFYKRENELIEQLYSKAKELKIELAFFKKEVSQQNIDKMITEKRREKERQRQVLEGRWRECTQSFKSMEEEQKKLASQQRESVFDLTNLQKKIEAFDLEIGKIKERIAHQSQNSTNFITQTKQNYKSPYKSCLSLQKRQLDRIEKEHRLLSETQQHFFSTKYNKCQEKIKREINQRKVNSKDSHCRLLRLQATHPDAQSIRPSWKCKQQEERCYTQREDQELLWSFFNNRDNRLKLFGLLKNKY